MDTATSLILSLYGLAGLGILVVIVYLIIRRIKIKKKEDFEKRDN